MTFKATEEATQAMFTHCERDYPNEACGYLVGQGELATEAIPMRNTHASATSYEMDPKEQMTLAKQLREKGLEQLAVYHSHVATHAYPSRRDIAQATAVQSFFEGHYVLVTLMEAGKPQARAFRIRDEKVTEEEYQQAS